MGKFFFVAVAIGYLLFVSFFSFQSAGRQGFPIRFLYPDTSTIRRIETAQAQHRTGSFHLLTRLFYNKPLGYFQTYLDTVYRSVDIPFLFTLTTGSSMYDDQGPMHMLFPWELLLFIPALIFLIRSGDKKYIWFLYYFLGFLLLSGFFLPPLGQLKLFPELIGIRLIIVFGWYEGVKKWLKK